MSSIDLGHDYVIRTRAPLDERIAVLEERLRDSYAEVDFASNLVGADGPANAAWQEARVVYVGRKPIIPCAELDRYLERQARRMLADEITRIGRAEGVA